MNILMLVLRFLHIIAAILWGGGSLIMHFFIGPTIKATNQTGQQFAGHLMLRTHFVQFMTAMAALTVIAGASLYWIDSKGFTSGWVTSTSGLGFAIGGIFGFVGFIYGATFGQLNKKLAHIGSQITGQPTQEQLASIQEVQKKIARVTPIHVTSVILAMVLMSLFRYFTF